MSLNDTPSAQRTHIAFFGKRNAGKSSLVNAVTGQNIAVVSDVKGTTTDPVYKSMELLPLGPVVIIDTPGFDDSGKLGDLRVEKTKQILNKTDIAVLVVDSRLDISDSDKELVQLFEQKHIPCIIVRSKSDLLKVSPKASKDETYLNVNEEQLIFDFREKLSRLKPVENSAKLISDKLNIGDLVILVVPIDKAAPKGRLILPQQQTIRDILDVRAAALIVQDDELADMLKNLPKKPRLVITDSQVFSKVSKIVPEEIQLTSFSILMARYKGFLETAVKGAIAIDNLEEGSTILISEGCTHHRQCDDIGTVKLPKLLKKYTQKNFNIETSSGTAFPEDLSKYSLVIHCGACMLNERTVQYRMEHTKNFKLPFTNYGTAIAYMNGILKRSLAVFPEICIES